MIRQTHLSVDVDPMSWLSSPSDDLSTIRVKYEVVADAILGREADRCCVSIKEAAWARSKLARQALSTVVRAAKEIPGFAESGQLVPLDDLLIALRNLEQGLDSSLLSKKHDARPGQDTTENNIRKAWFVICVLVLQKLRTTRALRWPPSKIFAHVAKEFKIGQKDGSPGCTSTVHKWISKDGPIWKESSPLIRRELLAAQETADWPWREDQARSFVAFRAAQLERQLRAAEIDRRWKEATAESKTEKLL